MSFTVELQPVDQEQQKVFEKQVLRDFYLSFKFSQGASWVQNHIYRSLVSFYRSQPDYDPTYVRENFIDLQSKLMRFKLPHSHTSTSSSGNKFEISSTDEAATFISQAQIFANILNTDRGKSVDWDSDTEMEGVGRGLVMRDKVYQSAERGYQATDPHSSYFRQYVLLHEPTGSEAYDNIFAQIPALVERDQYGARFNVTPIADRIASLANDWEYNHPGESFYGT